MKNSRRRVLFAHDGPMPIGEINDNFFVSQRDQKLFLRYQMLGDTVTFMLRIQEVTESVEGLSKIPGDNSNVAAIPNIKSITGHLKYIRKAKRKIAKCVKKHDILVARLPSAIGNLAVKYAKKIGKPYLVEFVGCTFDANWNYDWRGKIIAPYKYLKQKCIVKDVPHIMYVSNEFLQKRYPSTGKQIGLSDVELQQMDNNDLQDRLKRIEHLNTPLTMATVAALGVSYKGQDDAIRAVSKLKDKGISIQYKLVGGGNPQRLQELSRALNVEDSVEFIGLLEHEEVFKILNTIDFYIQPSKQEGLPRALVEAMSKACPAIGARTGGIPELLENECIFKPGDVSALVNKIKKIDKEWLEKHAKINFEEALNYQSDILAQKRQKFYEEFLRDNGFI